MKTIRINSIKISNFKGIHSFSTDFGDETNIYAFNGLGKSSIADAFFWCLWGKDQLERKDHEIKNTVNTDLNRQDHEVEIVFDVDGRHIPVKRVYAEKWTKRRGSNDQEFNGHETTLWFDEVPVPLKDFTARVNDLLDESIFKLITNPQYFNSLNWKDRRSMLIDMAGEITNADVAKGNPAFAELLEVLKNKSLDDYKTQIASQRKKVREELDVIPVKIGEATHNMPEERDWKELETELQTKKSQLEGIDNQIADKSKALQAHFDKEQERLTEINKLKSKAQNFKWQADQKANEANRNQGKKLSDLTAKKNQVGSSVKDLVSKEENIGSEIKSLTDTNAQYEKKKAELIERYHAKNAETFKVSDGFKCDHCGQDLVGDNLQEEIQKHQAEFNRKKESALADIKTEGVRYANAIENNSKRLEFLKNELHGISEKLEAANAEYFDLDKEILAESKKEVKTYTFEEFLDPEYATTLKVIDKLEAMNSEAPQVDTEELKAKKTEIQNEIGVIGNVLSDKAVIEKIKARIKELEDQERTLANQVSKLEGIEYTIQQFINAKMGMVEESVNRHFQFVRFKMFNTLVNGGTEETCETMLDGVPWSTLNTGGKLKAGIDIINAFSNYYQVHAPMILDNRESVFEIPYTENQVINLIASKSDKKLRVEIKTNSTVTA